VIKLYKYKVSDIVVLKKEHPCGTNRWEILRTGIEIKCLGCEREVCIKRIDFEKRLRKVEIDGKLFKVANL